MAEGWAIPEGSQARHLQRAAMAIAPPVIGA
jgi:hypothetical protein